jgi:hypothetical protein
LASSNVSIVFFLYIDRKGGAAFRRILALFKYFVSVDAPLEGFV